MASAMAVKAASSLNCVTRSQSAGGCSALTISTFCSDIAGQYRASIMRVRPLLLCMKSDSAPTGHDELGRDRSGCAARLVGGELQESVDLPAPFDGVGSDQRECR